MIFPKKIKFNGEDAYLQTIGPEDMSQMYDRVSISKVVLYTLEPDYLMVTEYIGKLEDAYFVTRVRDYIDSNLEQDDEGPTKKIVPFAQMRKFLIRTKEPVQEIKIWEYKQPQKGLGDFI